MKAIKVLIFLAVIGVTGYFAFNKYFLPTQATWLHGNWWYSDAQGNIVEGQDKDGMVFHPNGAVDLVYGSGKAWANCVYTTLVDREVRVKCEIRGKPQELIFIIRNDRTRLASVDDKEGGGYVRPKK